LCSPTLRTETFLGLKASVKSGKIIETALEADRENGAVGREQQTAGVSKPVTPDFIQPGTTGDSAKQLSESSNAQARLLGSLA
jgi:hypothetical protein